MDRVVPKMQTQDGVCPGKFYVDVIKHWHWWSPCKQLLANKRKSIRIR